MSPDHVYETDPDYHPEDYEDEDNSDYDDDSDDEDDHKRGYMPILPLRTGGGWYDDNLSDTD